MRTITIKQFQSNLYAEIQDLPVVVTQKGIPTFIVTAYDKVTTSEVTTYDEVATYPEEKVTTLGKCRVPYCKSQAVGEGEVYNNETGDMETVELCKIHLLKAQNEKSRN